MRSRLVFLCLFASLGISSLSAEPHRDLAAVLSKKVLDPETSMREVQAYCTQRVPEVQKFSTVAEWEAYADGVRTRTLANVVFRGAAAQWRELPLKVEYLDEIPGGPGYTLRKLRYEAVPGLWIPAVLYVPDSLTGKVPVVLNVNGHDPNGKAADYKQLRCINLVKRGMICLNAEWLSMGQLAQRDFAHNRLNQLDLCGTSGLAPFYLAMSRALDILLSHPHADASRVAVTGLSGGGWQTIIISALDQRVTLANPVAGYSSMHSRIAARSDLGDSEQQPVDLGLTADYTHLTALLAPRPALLTYNAKDDCCFAAPHALPRLLEAAEPVYKLYGRESVLRTHVNEIPGNHNFGQENREALYRMVGDHFFTGLPYDAHEIPSGDELKSKDQLFVPLPDRNSSLHQLAVDAMRDLPRVKSWPAAREEFLPWVAKRRDVLRRLLRFELFRVKSIEVDRSDEGGHLVTHWKLQMGNWTCPATEIRPVNAVGTTIVLADKGRASTSAIVRDLLARRQAVLAVDPYYFGESAISGPDSLYGILISSLGGRPLGIQAGQVAAVCDWVQEKQPGQSLTIQADGPRTSLIALCAAAVRDTSTVDLILSGSYGSLKEVIEKNLTVNEAPELFCFGLLEEFDILQLAGLIAPRIVKFEPPASSIQNHLPQLEALYRMLEAE